MLRGIDVSNHNYGINLLRIPGDFVIMRASEGEGMRDQHFKEYDAMVRPSSKLAGAYHFAWVGSQNRVINKPELEALNFYESIKDSLRPGFLIVLDWEPRDQLSWNTDWAVDCALKIFELTGVKPVLYANFHTLDKGLWARWRREIGEDYWMAGGTAQYSKMTLGFNPGPRPARNPAGWGDPVMWQYTEKGKLDGWHRDLDLNVFYGGGDKWRQLAFKEKEEESVTKVTGRIGDRYYELGGPNSVLGAPLPEDEVKTETGAWRAFENGFMLWSLETDARISMGLLRDAHGRFGYENGILGYPIEDPTLIPNGRRQRLERGAVYELQGAAQAFAVYGAIGVRYDESGGPSGPWGYPTSDEMSDGAGGRRQTFQHGEVHWSLGTGARFTPSKITIPFIRENDRPVPLVNSHGETLRSSRGLVRMACPCMAITFPLIEQEMIKRGLIRRTIDVFQAGYNPGVDASAGTHDMGGVIDVVQGISRDQRVVWADFGVIMAPRTREWGWTGGEHGHGGWHGCNHRTASLAAQVRNMMAGRDGLKSNIYRNWVSPKLTWQDSLRARGLAL